MISSGSRKASAKKYSRNGARVQLISEARDDTRVRAKIPTQSAPVNRALGQCSMASTPKAVATPLPPRKSKYTG